MSDLTAAVEAGARAMFDQQQATRRDDGRKRPDGRPWQWEDLPAHDKHTLRVFVLPIVTAAAAAIEDALLASGVLHDVTGLADDETLMHAAILAIQEVDDEAPYICAGEADQARAVLRSVETVLGGAE